MLYMGDFPLRAACRLAPAAQKAVAVVKQRIPNPALQERIQRILNKYKEPVIDGIPLSVFQSPDLPAPKAKILHPTTKKS